MTAKREIQISLMSWELGGLGKEEKHGEEGES
jgi:hypothetical protein